jgi:hypothetical protein
MGDQVDLLIFTGFCEVNFVSRPGNRAFIAKTRFWIVGRIKAQPGGREIFGFAPVASGLPLHSIETPTFVEASGRQEALADAVELMDCKGRRATENHLRRSAQHTPFGPLARFQ